MLMTLCWNIAVKLTFLLVEVKIARSNHRELVSIAVYIDLCVYEVCIYLLYVTNMKSSPNSGGFRGFPETSLAHIMTLK